jgi:diguanylate cyclase (GGDEF)-like protein
MSSLPTGGESRQQLIRLLEEATRGEIDTLQALLEKVPDSYAPLLRLLTQLDYTEAEAHAHWDAILSHRDQLSTQLGRSASLQVAALDYFQNLKGELRIPKILEMSTFLATERSAITDGLTGLYNRQFFDASLRRELKRARRYGLSFSLVMLDVDDFKTINDIHGHVVGDETLNLTSNVIRASVREIDVACRYGGEEFALILPETSRTGAYIVSERIRLDLKEMFSHQLVGTTHIDVSISGGIAIYPIDSNSAEGLVRMADKALYRSKHDGKDQITLHADEKRRSPRLESRKLLVFRQRKDNGREELRSETRNVSRNGALVESQIPLNIGTELEIDIHLPQQESSFVLKGRVVRLEETTEETGERARYHVGVAFLADTDEDAKKLEGFASEIYRPEAHDA